MWEKTEARCWGCRLEWRCPSPIEHKLPEPRIHPVLHPGISVPTLATHSDLEYRRPLAAIESRSPTASPTIHDETTSREHVEQVGLHLHGRATRHGFDTSAD